MKGLLVAALAASASLTACSQFDDPSDDDYEVVADGKEDNYRSPTALEFLAKSDATVTLAEAEGLGAHGRSVSIRLNRRG